MEQTKQYISDEYLNTADSHYMQYYRMEKWAVK